MEAAAEQADRVIGKDTASDRERAGIVNTAAVAGGDVARERAVADGHAPHTGIVEAAAAAAAASRVNGKDAAGNGDWASASIVDTAAAPEGRSGRVGRERATPDADTPEARVVGGTAVAGCVIEKEAASNGERGIVCTIEAAAVFTGRVACEGAAADRDARLTLIVEAAATAARRRRWKRHCQ